MYGTGTKILSLLLIAILVTSSFQTGFQNFSQNTNSNYTHKAFASNTVDITQISNYAVFGMQSAVIEKNATIVNGSVGVQNSGLSMMPHDNGNNDVQNNDGNNADNHNVEQENAVVIKKDSKFLDPNSALVGDNVIIEKGTTVQNVFFNKLQNAGTILGTQNTPLSLPVVKSLPPFPHSTPGSASIDVPDGSSLTLQPGTYGSISVGKSSTLNLVGGIYNVTSIEVADSSSLFFSSPSQVVVQNQTELGKGVTVGPSTSSVIHAHDIIFFVGGETSIEKNDTIKANIFSPSGDISIEKDANLTGAFIAKSVEIGKNSVITHDSAFVAFDLVNRFMNINSELGKISEISDESVVTDYLNQNITSLKTVTTNLVADSGARTSLLSILDSTLQSTSDVGNAVLSLDKTTADMKINDTRSFITSYINQVNSLSGTSIPAATANILLIGAQQILTNSFKHGTDTVVLVKNNPLIITGSIIDKAKTDGTSLRQITTSLISLGFKVTLNAVHHSPTVTDILFSNVATLQSFDVIIPANALSMYAVLGISDETASVGNPLSNAEFAAIMNATPLVVNNLLNSPDASADVKLAVAISCHPIFTTQECQFGFANPNSPLARFAIGPGVSSLTVTGFIIIECFTSDICSTIIDLITHEIITELGSSSLSNTIPGVTVVKVVNGGSLQASNFTIHVKTALLAANPSDFPAELAPGTFVSIPFLTFPGTNYTIKEDVVSGYTQSFSSDCNGSISSLGQHKMCTITNTFTPPVVPPVFFDNFDGADPTATGWSNASITSWSGTTCPTGYKCLGQSTTAFGLNPPSPPYWGFVQSLLVTCCFPPQFLCPPSTAFTSHAFTVPQAGNYNVSAWMGPSVPDGFQNFNQLYVDGSLVFNDPTCFGFFCSAPAQTSFDQKVIPISAGNHIVTFGAYFSVACFGAFPEFVDDIKIAPVSSPVTPTPVGGPYFNLQINQTSINATSGSTTVIPLKVGWQTGWNAEPVSAYFAGNLTSVVPSITSVTNTTSYQMFNVNLSVPSGTHTGGYVVEIEIKEPDGDFQFVPLYVRVK